jgi:hypothetical protein
VGAWVGGLVGGVTGCGLHASQVTGQLLTTSRM